MAYCFVLLGNFALIQDDTITHITNDVITTKFKVDLCHRGNKIRTWFHLFIRLGWQGEKCY